MSDESEDKKSRWAEYLKNIPWLGDYLEPMDKIAVVRMAGVIADNTVMRRAGINFNKFREPIAKAFETRRLKAVAVVINSPGGAPAQCSLITTQILDLAREKNIPVYAFVEDIAASGGYWIACAGQEIYAQETSIVGSIGVISSGFGLDRFIEKHEITRRVHTSGRDKSFLDPFRPEKAEDIHRLKTAQESMHRSFKDWVYERRGSRLQGGEAELMEGAFWTGADAVKLGIVDGIGDVVTTMKEKFGEDVRFVDCSPERKGLLAALLPFGQESAFDAGAFIEAAEEKSFWNRFGL
jgi:serine protease SohB